MKVMWIIIELLMSAVDYLLLAFFCSRMLKRNTKINDVFYYAYITVITLIVWIWSLDARYSDEKAIFGIISILSFPIVFYKGKLKTRILFGLIFFTSLFFSDAFAVGIMAYFNNYTWAEILKNDVHMLAAFGICRIIMMIMYTFISRYFVNETMIPPKKYWNIFAFFFSLFLLVIFIYVDKALAVIDTEIFNALCVVILSTFFVFYLITYFYFYIISNSFEVSHQKTLWQYQVELMTKYVLQKDESNEIIKVLSHDLKHNLSLIMADHEKQNVTSVINQIKKYEEFYDKCKLFDVNNSIANAIITDKVIYARSNNINLKIKGVFYDGLLVANEDLCPLLGNLLDNAIEASLKIPNPEDRKIEMKIHRDGHFLYINVTNNYFEEPLVSGEQLITTKKNRLKHGIGMLSINTITDKYDGAVKFEFANKEFHIHAMLRAY